MDHKVMTTNLDSDQVQVLRDVVLEAAVSARGRLEAVFHPVSRWLCLGDPAALAWLGLELSASASARSHDFCFGLGSTS